MHNTVWIFSSPTYMISMTLPSIVAVITCYGLIIIRHFFNVCKKLTSYTDINDIKLHCQAFMRPNNNRMAGRIWPTGRSLDTPVVDCSFELRYLAITKELSLVSHYKGNESKESSSYFPWSAQIAQNSLHHWHHWHLLINCWIAEGG